ncbi:Hypothetical predicted protein [Mytilus galloprovincialis]|uniref:CCHC-type domain-containing protein n=1 Tax=Mytilus galloprovincialis TaxID=29158 RepID=A0A8B6ENK2_MYTGA|nr:Hypothetical predicted protein [Mytilus galloprovincialis]
MDAELQQVIQTEVQNAVQSTQDQMLNSMTTLLDSRLEGFQKRIQDNQKVLSDTQIARMDESLTDSYKFRKRGNEEQHKHNQKVYAKIREAHAEFETDNLTQSNINSAKRKFSEGPRENSKFDPCGGSRSDVRPGRCFYCNEYGHWIRNCPKSAAEQKHKISIDTTICKIDKVEMYTHPKTDLASGELYSINVNSITQTSRDVQSMSNTHTTTIVKYNGTGVGHLKESLSEWKRIGATDFVLDIIANGYKIPFSTIPCMVELQNNKSARENPEFVKSEM